MKGATAALRPVALVSEPVQRELEARAVPLQTVVSRPDARLDAQALRRIELAFMSTDLVVGSSRGVSPELAAFFDQLRSAVNLRWLHVCSAGANRPVFDELLARGVRLTTSSGANAPEVSQSAIAGFLALARDVPAWVRAQQRREWLPADGQRPPRDLMGETAVVVGMGPIGREVARLLQALRVSVVGVSRTPAPAAGGLEILAYASLDQVLPRADWLILACPLTPQTRGMIDAARLALLPAGARVINVSRGAVMVEPDLVDALRSGRLGGAYLDVFEVEPLPQESPLWDLPGTLISAHRAGHSTGVPARTLELFIDNVRRWVCGSGLRNEVRARLADEPSG